MIPSFHPVREVLDQTSNSLNLANLTDEQRELACDTPPPTVDPASGLKVKNIDQLLASAKLVRYPDNPSFSYPDLLVTELTNSAKSPFTADGNAFWTSSNRPRIAVIGGGLSGLMAAWQLSKLGASVELFEAADAPNGDASNPKGAGRIRPINVKPDDANTRCEFGAMRFPDTSYMFWHYLKLMVPTATTTSFVEFPNPGKVPTLLSGEAQLSPFWTNANLDISTANDSGYNMGSLQARHINAFLNTSITIGGANYTLRQISTWMTDGSVANTTVTSDTVQNFWNALTQLYYNTSYLTFLQNKGFTAGEIAVIGYLGIGTGGFSPLFNTCVLDIMRLFIWSYDAEYGVPDLYKLPYGLKNALQTSGGGLLYGNRVNYIAYSKSYGKYCVFFQSGSNPTVYASGSTYDYVVCAMTHNAMKELFQAAPAATNSFISTYAPDPVFPFGAAANPNAKSAFYPDVKNQQGLSSVKIFQTMGGAASPFKASGGYGLDWLTPAAGSTAATSNYGKYLRVVFGKAGTSSASAPLGVTYMLPYGTQDFPQCQIATGLQYSWGADAIALRNGMLASDGAVNTALNASGTYTGFQNGVTGTVMNVYQAVNGRLAGKTAASGTNNCGIHAPYFAPFRSDPMPANEGYFAIVNWDQVPNVKMGFKLDAPGRGYPSIYRSANMAAGAPQSGLLGSGYWDYNGYQDPSVNGLFFCGDSFSHYGGWVEGAFQSAMNVTASIVYRAAYSSGWNSPAMARLSNAGKWLVNSTKNLPFSQYVGWAAYS